MLRIVENLLRAKIYRLVKRNKHVRNFAMRIWTFLGKAQAQIRRNLSRSSPVPPPTGYLTLREWIQKKNDTEFAAGSGGHKVEPLFAAETMVRKLPATSDAAIIQTFQPLTAPTEVPEALLGSMPDGRVWESGFVISPENLLVSDVSRLFHDQDQIETPESHLIFKQPQLIPPLRVDGRVAVLASFAGRGFYHWLYDVLPRLAILQAGGVALDSIDKFYVNEVVAPFQNETLAALGIGKDRLLQSHWVQHVQARELLVPSLPGKVTLMPRWACHFLRSTLGGSLVARKKDVTWPKRIFLSRKTAHRRLVNEPEIVAFLQKADFTMIASENYTFAEQIALFSSAEIIIGIHGAGFANLVFCNPSARVIEIFHPEAITSIYWTLAQQADLQYSCLTGHATPSDRSAPANLCDITVSLAALEQALAMSLD